MVFLKTLIIIKIIINIKIKMIMIIIMIIRKLPRKMRGAKEEVR